MDSGEFWKREHEKLDWKTPLKSLDLSQKEVENNRASQVVLVVKNLPANQCRNLIRDSAVIPGSGRSPGGGHVNPFQCSCLEKPMDKSQTRLKQISTEKRVERLLFGALSKRYRRLWHIIFFSPLFNRILGIQLYVCAYVCVCVNMEGNRDCGDKPMLNQGLK